MTKKDYIIIARQLKNTLENMREYEQVIKKMSPSEVFEAVIKDMCTMFVQDNPKFDAQKFAKACGLPQMKEGGNDEVVARVAARIDTELYPEDYLDELED